MKKSYMSLNERLDRSRKHFKSLLSEQTVTCTGVDNNGTSIAGNPNWCATWDNLPANNPAPPLFTGTNAEFFDACGCPTSGTTSSMTCYACINGNVVANNVWNQPMSTAPIDVGVYSIFGTFNSSTVVPITGEGCVVDGHSFGDNGINMFTNPTPYNANVQGSTGEYWFTDQSFAQGLCNSGTTSSSCTLSTFQNMMAPHLTQAPTQFVGQLMNNWLPMFFGKYENHSNPCRFLTKRLEIQETKLADLQTAGTNPQWQAMLTAKIAAIQAIIAECCGN